MTEVPPVGNSLQAAFVGRQSVEILRQSRVERVRVIHRLRAQRGSQMLPEHRNVADRENAHEDRLQLAIRIIRILVRQTGNLIAEIDLESSPAIHLAGLPIADYVVALQFIAHVGVGEVDHQRFRIGLQRIQHAQNRFSQGGRVRNVHQTGSHRGMPVRVLAHQVGALVYA